MPSALRRPPRLASPHLAADLLSQHDDASAGRLPIRKRTDQPPRNSPVRPAQVQSGSAQHQLGAQPERTATDAARKRPAAATVAMTDDLRS